MENEGAEKSAPSFSRSAGWHPQADDFKRHADANIAGAVAQKELRT